MKTSDFCWPERPFHIVLVEPEIPPNTGNIARLCAATGSTLHLVGPLGFRLTDRELKRAGLDYWESVKMVKHDSFETFLSVMEQSRIFLFSARGDKSYHGVKFRAGDVLVFGGESRGLPEEIIKAHAEKALAIPMKGEAVRSLNLATAVGIVLYEALRQQV